MRHRGELYTLADDALLRGLARQGMTSREIGDEMGRSRSSVISRAGKLGVRLNGVGRPSQAGRHRMPAAGQEDCIPAERALRTPDLDGEHILRSRLHTVAPFKVTPDCFDRWWVKGERLDTYELLYRINVHRKAEGLGPVLVRCEAA